jgi:DNA topoisomerase-3
MFDKLYIAEKPSLGKAIAEGLVALSKRPGNERGDSVEQIRTERGVSHLVIGGKIAVAWFFGHMLEQVYPETYDAIYGGSFTKSAHLLPIIPKVWRIEPVTKTKTQLLVVRDLIKQSKVIVNAGDPDAEGMLLIQEALVYFNVDKPVLRLLPNAMDTDTIKKAILSERDNNDFMTMYYRALGRQRSDWLVGMNMSRACTCANTMGQLLSVGRVQTPTLSLVVRRDHEIDNFKPETYFTPTPEFLHSNGKYTGKWICPKGLDGIDSENRLTDEAIAKSIVSAVTGKTGVIKDYSVSDGSQSQPLPFSLSTIQQKANALFGLSAKQVLNVCQSLYETHKVASYPRTDTGYLKESQHAESVSILASISKFSPEVAALVLGTNPSIKSPAWNDKQVVAHHGIIPTAAANYNALTPDERKVFTLIVKNYIAQFYPEFTFKKTSVVTECGTHQFKSNGRTPVDFGWKKVFGSDDEDASTPKKKDGEEDQMLPFMKKDDAVTCLKIDLGKKITKAPPRYTESSLLRAMSNISETVTDPIMKKKLIECKGIGTPATQADVIEKLKTIGFLDNKSKQLISSMGAREFISGLPPELTDAALTAQWETALDRVQSGSITLEQFMEGIEDWITKLTKRTLSTKISINLDKKAPANELKAAGAGEICGKCNIGVMMPRKATKGTNAGNYFLGCSAYPVCKNTQNVVTEEKKEVKSSQKQKAAIETKKKVVVSNNDSKMKSSDKTTTQSAPIPASTTVKKISFGTRIATTRNNN